jgi:chorismate mutase
MKIDARIRELVNERMALVAQAESVKQSLQAIPVSKHAKLDYSLVRIADLSAEEQARIIRLTHKAR